jgi:hypothetical protein
MRGIRIASLILFPATGNEPRAERTAIVVARMLDRNGSADDVVAEAGRWEQTRFRTCCGSVDGAAVVIEISHADGIPLK